ncbi:ABC transporter permease [Flavobacterium sp.]|uniref:ABC transporter permease n=1 Tax=Flavobacterium sp. TaxID=239 RepID=UPI0039E5E355
MKNFGLLFKREFAIFRNNKIFLIAFLGLPLLLSLTNAFVYRKAKIRNQPIVIVDKDDSPSSRQFVQMLADHNILNPVSEVPETIDLNQTLIKHKAVAIVVIPDYFEANLLQQRKPEVNCYLNMANTISSGAVSGAVSMCTAAMNASLISKSLQKKGIPSTVSANYMAIKSNTFFEFNRGSNYLYFLWPGLIFATLHQLLLLALAISFSGEMEAGTFNYSGLLSVTDKPLLLILVKLLPYFLMSLFTIGLYFILSFIFRVPLPKHPELLLFSQLLLVIGATLLGILYSILFPIPLKASQTLMSIATPAFTLSGFTWPVHQDPWILAAFGKIVPLTPYLRLLRMTLIQDADWAECLPQLKHQTILIVVYLILSWWLLASKIKKAKKQLPTNINPTT